MHPICPIHPTHPVVRRTERQSGVAILMVVLVLVGLVIIGAPFAISMRQEELAAINFAARTHAKLAAIGSLNLAKAQLERSHEYYERIEAQKNPKPTIYNSPYVDSSGELRVDFTDPKELGISQTDFEKVTNPAGTMWSARAEDEQGKINVKNAPKALLRNILLEITGETFDWSNPDATRAAQIATEIADYRRNHPITSLAQLRTASPTLAEDEFQRLCRFLTIYSAPFVSETISTSTTQYPVNVNTCSAEVLRALLRGIKLRQPGVPPANQHKGVGYATSDLDTDGDGKTDKTIADDFEELIRRLRVFAKLAGPVTTGSPTVTLDDATLFPQPRQGNPTDQEVDGYWISIEGDAVRYWKKENSVLSITQSPDYLPTGGVDKDRNPADMPVEVRLLFVDLAHDLGGVLEELVNEGKLTPESKAAILANAINPSNATVLDTSTTTAPLCTHSFNIYTIEATGIMNAPDGRELARYTIKEVAQVAPSVELEIRIDTQEDFQRSFYEGMAKRLQTWPNATQVSDVAPRSTEPPEALFFHRHGRLGLEPYLTSPGGPARFALSFVAPFLDQVLNADPAPMPHPVKALTKLNTQPGDDTDLGPDGLHVGQGTLAESSTETHTLAYTARVDEPATDPNGNPLDQDNIAHDRAFGEVRPLILSLWVKPDASPRFDYGKDHFFFDLGHESYSNRLALYYDATGPSEGDLVLRVCDSTLQYLAAEIRYHVTPQTFQPECWHHIEAIVKGIHYNEMALLVNGRSVGRYYPCARLAATVDSASLALSAGNLVGTEGGRAFLPFVWPQTGGALLGGEILNYANTAGGALTVAERGARGSQPRAHAADTRIELFGYNVRVTDSDNHTLQPLPFIAQSTAYLPNNLPASFATATVDDGDDGENAKAPDDGAKPTTFTADGTADYADPAKRAASYTVQAGSIPDDWLPVAASKPWVVDPGAQVEDNLEFFKEVVDYAKPQAGLLSLVCWTDKQLTTTNREITEEDGLGFFRLVKNPEDVPEEKQELVKFSKAGVVLVWRYHPTDAANPDLKDEEKRKMAWYIGYVAGLTRRCFGTGEGDDANPTTIVETAQVHLDCIKVSDNSPFARGIRGKITKTYDVPTIPPKPMTEIETYEGDGILEIRAAMDSPVFEWISFRWPSFAPDATSGKPIRNEAEETLCAGKFLVGIRRPCQGEVRGMAPAPQSFAALAVAMPVLFVASTQFTIGPGDQVTVTDATGQRENRDIYHVKEYRNDGYNWWRRFTFVQLPARQFFYARNPRLLKFPSGTLPIAPDKCFYLGSDTLCVDGNVSQPYSDGGADRVSEASNTEPERPANATIADVRITETSNNTARLWDWTKTGGPPDPNKGQRWVSFGPESDAAPIPADLKPPFYVRLGSLERITPRKTNDPLAFAEPYRFLGHVGWPTAGYVKINDEVMFYRKLYHNRTGSHSARLLLPEGSLPKDSNGLAIALQPGQMTIYVDAEQAKDFPQQGYVTISNSAPKKDFWGQFREIAQSDPQNQQALLAWLNQGNPLCDREGKRIDRYDSASGEYMFYDSREETTVRGQKAIKLNLAYRGILNSTQQQVKVVDPNEPPTWFIGGISDLGSATVSVVPVEFLILERGCLGTERESHPVGSVMMPLDHIPATLIPRKLVKLQRGEDGRLLRTEDGKLKALADDDPAFDPAKPQYEYGLPIETTDGFPTEGYVQVGKEIIGYALDSANLFEASLPSSTGEPVKLFVLTGFKLLRQRYGTEKADYLTSGGLATVDPDATVPEYYAQDDDFQAATQTLWNRRVVRLLRPRYHDRYPISDSGEFTPHRSSAPVAYWEFAYSLPGALWTKVNWTEVKHDGASGTLVNDTLKANDPWDIQLMVQLDNAPAWDDTALDPVTNKPVAQPVPWSQVPSRTDVVYDPPCLRVKKPVIYLFDDPQADNYINPKNPTTLQGQYADRIRLRVYFKFNPYNTENGEPPNYNIPWRTPWVDSITLRYKAPTHVLEHREMPY